MYAVIETGGKQYKVEAGSVIYVEKLAVADGETVTFDKVLAVGGEKTSVGTPFVKDATVTGTVVKQVRSKKLHVLTYKAKKNEKRKIGHRQNYTKVEITAIHA